MSKRTEAHRDDVTVAALDGMVDVATNATPELAEEGIECEIVDPRTIVPLDRAPILESVRKTNVLVIVHEAPTFGGKLVAQVAEKALFHLDAPVERIGAPFTPVPFAESLERAYLPDEEDVRDGIRSILRR